MQIAMPEMIWMDASWGLPGRMLGLARWAALGVRLTGRR
jgi:hypothetical protein